MGVPLRVLVTDHPPAHGEHFLDEARDLIATGSSPRARGALAEPGCGTNLEGIIPACAGSTYESLQSPTSSRDHPRVRGEHGAPWNRCPTPPGSSPRARGARQRGAERVAEAGIIPACAGSTSAGSWNR